MHGKGNVRKYTSARYHTYNQDERFKPCRPGPEWVVEAELWLARNEHPDNEADADIYCIMDGLLEMMREAGMIDQEKNY